MENDTLGVESVKCEGATFRHPNDRSQQRAGPFTIGGNIKMSEHII